MSTPGDLPPTFPFPTRRTARYARLGPDRAPVAWIALHGYRQLAPWFLRHLRPLDDGTRLLIAPEGLNRFYVGDPDGRHGPGTRVGATWMTREDRDAEIADYIYYLDSLAEAVVPESVPEVVLGFSQGAHTAARWILESARVPSAVLLWGEGFPHDVDRDALRAASGTSTRWILVRGRADRSRNPEREAAELALAKEAGLDLEVRIHPGGHALDADLLKDLARELEPKRAGP